MTLCADEMTDSMTIKCEGNLGVFCPPFRCGLLQEKVISYDQEVVQTVSDQTGACSSNNNSNGDASAKRGYLHRRSAR